MTPTRDQIKLDCLAFRRRYGRDGRAAVARMHNICQYCLDPKSGANMATATCCHDCHPKVQQRQLDAYYRRREAGKPCCGDDYRRTG
jgi:hypothetical protein